MCIEINSISDEDFLNDYSIWAQGIGLWDGRYVSIEDVKQFQDDVVCRIGSIFAEHTSNSVPSLQMAAIFAKIGSRHQEQSLLSRDVQALGLRPDGLMVMKAGIWDSACDFWDKYRTEIIIGVAILVVVTIVVVVAVCSGGSASAAAGAVGCAAIDQLDKSQNPSPKTDPVSPITVAECIQGIEHSEHGVTIGGEYFSHSDLFQALPPFFGPIPEFPKAPMSTPFDAPPSYFSQPSFNQLDLVQMQRQLDERRLEIEKAREGLLTGMEISTLPYINYASQAYKKDFTADFKNKAPFLDLPLFGYPDQSTIHYHCGINNSVSDMVAASECLYQTFGEELAIQPHRIHNEGLFSGLAKAKLGQFYSSHKAKNLLERIIDPISYCLGEASGLILKHSDIQKSIDYEVENLTTIANQILQIGNPKLKQVHVTFSNGGYVFKEALERLTYEQQQTIIVFPVGTTAIIKDNKACKVYNIIGDYDLASQNVNGGMRNIEAQRKDANILLIQQDEVLPVELGHYILQPNYQKMIKDTIIAEVLKEYEIY